MTNSCETCGMTVTAHNSKKFAHLTLCVGCYDVMKTLEGKPRNEVRQMAQELKGATLELMQAKGFQNPEQDFEELKKRIQEKERV